MFILALVAFFLVIAAALGKCPLWVPVLLISIIELIERIPLGR